MKTDVRLKEINRSRPDGSLRVLVAYSVCALVCVVVLAAKTAGQSALTAPFTRITNGVIGAELGMSVVGAWGDYDNDGWLDLFVANNDDSDWLFRNNTNGTFTKVNSGPVVSDPSAQSRSAAWADYDNDGWLDLIVGSYDGARPNRLYRNVGGGSFLRRTAAEVGSVATDVSRCHGLAWADYDNDGHLDLFAANGGGVNLRDFLYHNEGNGTFTQVSNPVTTPVLSSSVANWSDYDNDGDMDLFVLHTGGVGNSLFRNNGMGQFVEVTTASRLGDIDESLGAAWGDYDNDGDLDLFVTNIRFPAGPVTENFFYRNKGDGTFERITTGELAMIQDHFVSCVWVDYDNDGWLDLFLTVYNQVAPQRLYRNQGDGTFVRVTQGSLMTDSGVASAGAWGDYDNDGFPDVFVAHGAFLASERSALYRNNGNSNSWIKIKCVGTLSNRSAIGAKVRVLANIGGTNRWQMRQIVGTEGWATFNSLDVMIGLGNATNINTLRIEWPSSIVQEFHNVAVKQTLTIVERTTLAIQSRSQNQFDVTIKGPRQQRYRLESSTNLAGWSSMTSLTITNADGTASFRYTSPANDRQRFFRAAAE